MSTASYNSHGSPPLDKPKRAKLSHIQIDVDFFSKPKILALRYRLGDSGVLFLISIMCDMGRGTNGEIDLDCARARGAAFGFDEKKTDDILEYLIGGDLIHKGSKDHLLSNRRIQSDQCALARKQEKWREEKRVSRTPSGQITDIQRTSSGHLADIQPTPLGPVNTEDLNTEDLKKEGGAGGEPPNELTPEQKKQILAVIGALPLDALGLGGTKVAKALRLWARHTVLNLKKPFDPISAEALVASYQGRGEDFSRDVLASVQGRYRRVYTSREAPSVPPPKDLRRTTVSAHESEVLKRLGGIFSGKK